MNQAKHGGREVLLKEFLDSASDPMVVGAGYGKIHFVQTLSPKAEEPNDQQVGCLIPPRLASELVKRLKTYCRDKHPRKIGSGLEF